MIIQFLLKLIFFYFLYTFLKSVLRSYMQKKASDTRTRNSQQYAQNESRRTKKTAPSADIFEAEYKVIKEEGC